MAHVVYTIVEHDGGWAYKLGDVFSEPFPSRDAAVKAAHRVANYGMIVAAGREESAIRAAWAHQTYLLISLAGIVGLIIVLVLFGIVREMLREKNFGVVLS